MASFHLQIVTPDGLSFDGQAEKLIVRTVTGEVCILPRHINYVTSLGMGEAVVVSDGAERRAACIGGMLSVSNNEVKLVPSTFEWAEDIDADRAARAKAEAEAKLSDRANLSKRETAMAEAKLKRALVRQSVANK
ncbi:MAG: ATP synthase F1 subunit epsilon [Oscillospiraceae bacterium]